jgi:hypothetical protein
VRAILDLGFRGNPNWIGELTEWGRSGFVRYLPEGIQFHLMEAPGRTVTWVLCSRKATLFPWELLHDGVDFLCRKQVHGRLLQTDGTLPRAKVNRRAGEILILADPAADLPSAYEEGAYLSRYLEQDTFRKTAGQTDAALPYLLGEAGKESALGEIGKASLVHFCGHSRCTGEDATTGWFLSGGEFLNLADIRELGRGESVPGLVFSNSCCSSDGGEGDPDLLAGIAGAFLSAGVAGYVGTICPIEDGTARDFARDFYSELRWDESFATRLHRVCNGLPPGNPAWAAYRYYGDPGFCLKVLDRPTPSPAGALPEAHPGQGGERRAEPHAEAAEIRAGFPWLSRRSAIGAACAAAIFAGLMAGVILYRDWLAAREPAKQNFIYQEGFDVPAAPAAGAGK